MSGNLEAQQDFLTRMVDKALGTGMAIRPRVRSVFEPPQETWIAVGANGPEEPAALVETAAEGQPDEPLHLAEVNRPPPQAGLSVSSAPAHEAAVAPAVREKPFAAPARPERREVPQGQSLAPMTQRRDAAPKAQPAPSDNSTTATLHNGSARTRSLGVGAAANSDRKITSGCRLAACRSQQASEG